MAEAVIQEIFLLGPASEALCFATAPGAMASRSLVR
jgi:hypothetical protein